MATAKVIKGEQRIVKEMREVEVVRKDPDKVRLELSQDEVNVLKFVLGQQYGVGFESVKLSTFSIYEALKSLTTEKLSERYKVIGHLNGWKIVPKPKDGCDC